MASGIPSSCHNHRSIEAVGRCKQCGKPFCSSCRVAGPTGNFCAEECKQAHEQFIDRAEQLDDKKRLGLGARIWDLGKKILIVGVVVMVLAFVATRFLGINVPILSDIIRRFMG